MSAYATSQDITDRNGADQLVLIADRDGDGVADAAAVSKALEDASAEIDAYLAVKYTLPLASPPPLLAHLCVDIAVYRLAADAYVATDERRKRFDDALLLLLRLATGEASLGIV